MKQLVFGFGNEQPVESSADLLEPETQEILVTLMARAILTVAGNDEEQGGRNDDAVAVKQQDQATAPESEGRGLSTPVH